MVKEEDVRLAGVVYKPTKTEKKSKNLYIYLVAAISNLTALAAGISLAWVSPVLPKLDGSVESNDNPLGRSITPGEASWIAGLLQFSAMFVPLMSGIANKFGRKPVLLIAALLMTFSFLITAFARTIFLMYLSRILLGLGTGNVFAVLPMYLGEIAENQNRGGLTCSMGMFVASGFNFSYIVGSSLSIRNFCFACTCPLLIFIACFPFLCPESPVFLASIDNERRLKSGLGKIRNNTEEEIGIEMRNLIRNATEKQKQQTTLRELVKSKSMRKALTISLGLIVFQQFCGIGAITSYLQVIFDATGAKLSSQLCTIIVGTVQVFATILAVVVVDRLGRRFLLLTSALGMCTSLATLGLYFYLNSNMSWLPVTSLIVFMMAFNFGIGPVPWAVIAEVFPSNVRSSAAALCSLVCFLAAFVIIYLFRPMSKSVGMANCFWIFSVVCLLLFIFVYVLLPETKGKSFEEIQNLLGDNRVTI